ncbi:MAG: penicillin-binding transpeptidase domain-containing protein [Eubacteriaceae bacterium]
MIIRNEKIRYIFLKILVFIVAGIIIFRLAELQIVNGKKYKSIAENNMYREITIEAPRGDILSSDMQTLATNKIAYAVDLIYTNVDDELLNGSLLNLSNVLIKNQENIKDTLPLMVGGDGTVTFTFLDKTQEENWKKEHGFADTEIQLSPKETLDKLKEEYKISPNYNDMETRQIILFREQLKDQSFRSWNPIRVASDIKRETVYEIDENQENLVGVSVIDEPVRFYPQGSVAAHILGYAGEINEEEFLERRGTKENYGYHSTIGKTGLEVAFEKELRGEIGKEMTITDYMGRPQYDIMNTKVPAQPGDSLVTTFNLDFQRSVENILSDHLKELQTSGVAPKAESGAVVVLDVNSGGVLTMASLPTYDPNLFTTAMSDETWESLNVTTEDPLAPKPLYNNSTLTALQPGSTFKPLMGIAGLEAGVINQGSTFFCNGKDPHLPIFTCLGYHGNTDLVDALRDSCNVFFYETGYELGIEPIVNLADAFGLGKETGIEIYETPGTLGGRDNLDEGWSEADTLNTSIGQGGSSFTPLQMANYIGTLVNGGNHFEPYLVKEIKDVAGGIVFQKTPKLLNQIEIKKENLALVKEGMKEAVENGAASKYFYGFDHENIGVGGKTGTAEYGDAFVDNTSWFVCFAPYETPEIAIAVMIIQGDTSLNAVPVAREILDMYFESKLNNNRIDGLEGTP